MPFPFRDRTFQFQTLRALGYAASRGADPNEVFELCGRIRNANLDDWFTEWHAAGLRALRLAEESDALQDIVSRREAFLRASNYMRTAEFFRRHDYWNDAAAQGAYRDACSSFNQAMALLEPSITFKQFNIPIPGLPDMPAYILIPDNSSEHRPRRTIVLNGGFDSIKEEGYFAFGATALARGYNFVAFDGPGQGAMIRRHRIPFRADWQAVIRAVTDTLVAREEIDQHRLVLVGWSMGGWLSAQALTKEHRYAAVVLNGGVYDFAAGWRRQIPWFVWSLLERRFNATVSLLVSVGVRADVGKAWGYQNALWTLGVADGATLLSEIVKYTLTPDAAQQIKTPMLILDAQNDHLLGGQPTELISHLGSDQRYDHVVCETRYGAGEHCHMGAMGEQDRIIYNWLQKALKTTDQ